MNHPVLIGFDMTPLPPPNEFDVLEGELFIGRIGCIGVSGEVIFIDIIFCFG